MPGCNRRLFPSGQMMFYVRKGVSDMVNITNSKGSILISGDVISNLAGDAATGCFGVKGMVSRSQSSGPLQLLRRESMSKGVEVVYNDDQTVSLQLHIGVDQGVNIFAVSRSIINEVNYKLSQTAGIPVKTIDVFVDTIIG